MEIKKATLVNLLKSMAAKRAEQRQTPIVLNRDSELFQSYLEQRRSPRAGEYPFLGPLFRDEIPITTPSPGKFKGGASVYKPSTPSPQIDDSVSKNGIDTQSENYKITDESSTAQPLSIPAWTYKQLNKTKPTFFKDNSVQHLRPLDANLLSNKTSNVLATVTSYFPNSKEEESNPFPSFGNQFFKYYQNTTLRPPSVLFEEINNDAGSSPLKFGTVFRKEKVRPTFVEFTSDISSHYDTTSTTIYTTHRSNPITTVKPSTLKPTQKYYMNLVTDQTYTPPKIPLTQGNGATQPSLPTFNYKTINKPAPTTSSLTLDSSPSYSSYHGPKTKSTKSHPSIPPNKYKRPVVFNKDSPIINTKNKEYISPSFSSTPSRSPISSENPSGTTNTKYESIDEPKFYYKPIISKPQTKENIYKESQSQTTYVKPSNPNEGTIGSYKSPQTLISNSQTSNYSPVFSQIENTTPHPLIYGFKPVKYETKYHPSISSDYRSPKFLTTPPVSTPLHIGQLYHFGHNTPPKTAYQGSVHSYYGDPNISVGKPIRFPYDKRHYYSGRFVSTFRN